ncbi:hypothetical protein [Flavobacterium sp.]|jgi:hypothetical protein|uniref:hypothetical protein n=1 Tax=Flavobacterium sp. TaxID=239 RepID=UPI0037BF0F12
MATIRQQFSSKMLVNEGIDHLNLNRFNSSSRLSPLLADDWQSPFTIPYMGSFRSCMGFALWVLTGDEQYRGPVPHRDLVYQARNARVDNVEEYRDLVLYAKFYQLVSLGHKLIKDTDLIGLPWVSYVKHQTGVREYAPWSSYPLVVKEFVKHILANSTTIDEVQSTGHFEYNYAAKFPHSEQHPFILDTFQKYMQKMVGDDFVSPEDLPPLAGKVFNVAPKKEKPKAEEHSKHQTSPEVEKASVGPDSDLITDDGVMTMNVSFSFPEVSERPELFQPTAHTDCHKPVTEDVSSEVTTENSSAD